MNFANNPRVPHSAFESTLSNPEVDPDPTQTEAGRHRPQGIQRISTITK
jgi:hypothetical protein